MSETTDDDIVVRFDRNGFVISATPNFTKVGYDLDTLLLKPHLTDLAAEDAARELGRHFREVLDGAVQDQWHEFALRQCAPDEECAATKRRCWCAIGFRRIVDESGEIAGAVARIRSAERQRALGGELFSRALVDPLTGFANRHALYASLRRQLASGRKGMLVLVEVDRLRAIFLQYGQSTSDEIVWGFARFLEAMALPGCELAQFDAERFCVLLPEASTDEAGVWAADLLETFGSLTPASSPRVPRLTASAGLAPIERSADWTLRQAELGLVMARAGGGMRVARARCHSAEGERSAQGQH
ncbi:MAG: GGDEF domain-containing protein [Erythrobacter sp.]|nr:GGDEF domain-containing protein [Erythrobacter sp.]